MRWSSVQLNQCESNQSNRGPGIRIRNSWYRDSVEILFLVDLLTRWHENSAVVSATDSACDVMIKTECGYTVGCPALPVEGNGEDVCGGSNWFPESEKSQKGGVSTKK